ncbi:MAG: legume-like lectin family-domain-containing protein [Linnemannia gamsii]|nr:MAG: legume-like lectin family-domain-containing protein [Linnemannia gamsii]
MKPTILLVAPILFLSSTALAWGRGGSSPSSSSRPATPDDNVELPADKRRFDYKQSLKKPFQYNNEVPFWKAHGNAFVALDFVRLAPSVPNLRGSVWRLTPNEHKEWEVEVAFKANGQGANGGGRGFAFWYTEERAVEGPVFGNKDKFKGLGVFMDTADPANQRSHPVIYGITNDGSKEFPANPAASSMGGCLRDYKNSPVPVVIRISYIGKTLKVSVDTLNKGKKMISCFEEKNVDLPTGYHFGFSAMSSIYGSPDDHDLHSFEVFEVNPPPRKGEHLRPHEAEMIKKGEEAKVDEKDKATFEEVQKIVAEQEQRLKEETDGPAALSAAQLAATVGDTQHRIVESLNIIHKKLESLGAPVQPAETTAKSLEEMYQKISSMAASLHAMESVVEGLVSHIMTQSVHGSGPDVTKVMRDELKNLHNKMEDMDSRQSFQHMVTQDRLSRSRSWVSYVVFLVILQVVAVSAYSWYKKRIEMSDKKFI